MSLSPNAILSELLAVTCKNMSNIKIRIQRFTEIITYGHTMYRGIMALVLGILLIFYPTKTENELVNMMGWFWLASGFALIRQPRTERAVGKPMSWGIGLVAMLTGLLVVTRDITRVWVPEIAVVELLGVAILLTGVVHMFGQFRLGKVFKRREETLDYMLGFYEIVLGLVLISTPLKPGPITYWAATIWSSIFGIMILGNALAMRVWKQKGTDAPTQQDRPEPVAASDEG
jgi:uncharacterized membrane protein HdeD (DUF308 family)